MNVSWYASPKLPVVTARIGSIPGSGAGRARQPANSDRLVLSPFGHKINGMQRPEKIRNEAKWVKDCTKIRARALDVIDERIDLTSACVALRKLAIWTHAQADPDLMVFDHLLEDLAELPIGPERAYWAPVALARDDMKIKAVVDKWRPQVLAAARKLVDRYEWSLVARAALRSAGHPD